MGSLIFIRCLQFTTCQLLKILKEGIFLTILRTSHELFSIMLRRKDAKRKKIPLIEKINRKRTIEQHETFAHDSYLHGLINYKTTDHIESVDDDGPDCHLLKIDGVEFNLKELLLPDYSSSASFSKDISLKKDVDSSLRLKHVIKPRKKLCYSKAA